MNKTLFLALLVVGVVLIVLGVNASESIRSDFSRFFTGEPTDRALWLLVGGGITVAFALGGLGNLARGSKSAP